VAITAGDYVSSARPLRPGISRGGVRCDLDMGSLLILLLVGIALVIFAVAIVRQNGILAIGSWLTGWVILVLVAIGGLVWLVGT
jgi:hypothetical protein